MSRWKCGSTMWSAEISVCSKWNPFLHLTTEEMFHVQIAGEATEMLGQCVPLSILPLQALACDPALHEGEKQA